jgi:Family of unknown function (DUF6623)
MALKAAMWVHGNTVHVEGPVEGVTLRGDGALVTGKSDVTTRFHFPIPTPVVLDERRLRLVRVFVLYDTRPQTVSPDALGPKLLNVRVFDGSRLVGAFDHLALTGPHDKALDGANTFTLAPAVEVFFGLSLSVSMFFEGAPSEEKRTILFTAAGADFE